MTLLKCLDGCIQNPAVLSTSASNSFASRHTMAQPPSPFSAEATKSPHPSKKIVEQSYDNIAPTYLKWTSSFSSPRLTYLNKLLPLLPPPTSCSILELGCGAGVPCTQILARHSSSLVAVDISAAQLELAKENVKSEEGEVEVKMEFVKSDMHALSFPNETFDAIVGFYSIIHLPREEQVVLVKRIEKWLKPGGYFLANFSASASDESWKESWLVEGSGMFWSSWEEGQTLDMVKAAGLEVLDGLVEWEDEGPVGGGKVGFLWVLARKEGEGGFRKGEATQSQANKGDVL
jgi:ubiquinone/menaquinone biosynthesis C-methylase UbiE